MSRTIKEAIVEVLGVAKTSLTSKEIYEKIVEKNLYEFKSKNPVSIINSELRKSCVGIDLKKSRTEKLFEQNENGKFSLVK